MSEIELFRLHEPWLHEMVRGTWKNVLLTSLTFGCASGTSCQASDTTSLLQIQQRGDEEREIEEMTCTKVPEHTCMTTAGPYPFKAHAPYDEDGIEGKKDDLPVADCPLCHAAGYHGATLFGVERFDGMGERGAGLIKMLALADYAKMNFGGILPSGNESSHGVDMPKSLSTLLGADYSELLLKTEKPQFEHCFYSDEQIFLDAAENPPWSNGDSVLFATCRTGPWYADILLTDEFRKKLRESSPLMTQKVQHFEGALQEGGKITIAMHVRRGDLETGSWRAVPDEMNFEIIDKIKDAFDNVDFHVFSSTEGKHESSEFDGYRDRGVNVHLDGEVDEDWAHMAQADILLLAQSTFGWVPAVLSDKCVVAFSSFHHLPDWILHHDGDMHDGVLSGIKDCIEKKGLPHSS